jgi:tetratricopeptide (TPR) repeat protein
MSEPARADVRYTAFLSYSHKDAAAAGRLHRRLEAYRIPKRLVGSDSPRGPVPERLSPIFRDREELPAASDLSETVRTALAQSGALIILCSANAAGSLWVAEEIDTFRKLHPHRPILAAILDGDPPDCFPEALRAFGQDGTWHEPLATDLRPQADGKHLGLLKLVAGITGLGLDDLVQRDASRRVRRITTLGTMALVAMLIMTALAVTALNARREAEQQRAEAEGLVEFMLTDLRTKLRGVGNTEIMIDVNRRALALYGGEQVLAGLSPDSLGRRARILHAIGEDEKERGQLPIALRAFREAHRITGEQLARAPRDPERIFYHAQSEYWLASIDEQRGNYSAALAAYLRYRGEAERMSRSAPNDPRFLGEIAYAESNLGSVNLSGFRRYSEARRHFENSLRLFNLATQRQPANRDWREQAADAHAWIADTYYYEHRYEEARAERLIERQLKQQLLDQEPNNRAYLYALAITNRVLGRIDIELRKFERALPSLENARSAMTRLLAIDPDNITWRDQATMVESNRAELFAETGRRSLAAIAMDATRALLAGTDQRRPSPSAARERTRARLERLSAELRDTSLQ